MRAVELLKQATSLANFEVQRSGYVPSPQHARHIQDMSQALSTELSNIEAEVALLQQLHRRITVQLGIHKSFLSPIRRLPLELLSEIFAILYDREDETGGKMYMIIYVLSRVCSTWRVLVRATPRFWARIPTVVFSVQHNVSFTHIHHIPDYILLSGTLPLCLTHVEPDNDELLKEFLQAFEPHLERIGHIDFDGSCAYFAAIGNNLHMPNAVEAGMALSGPLLPGTLDFLGNSPALRTVELFHVFRDGVNYAPEFRFPALPALTWLTLEFRGIISTDAVLGNCRSVLLHVARTRLRACWTSSTSCRSFTSGMILMMDCFPKAGLPA
ncbi:hypothetical protein K525DRAFT_266811 [Schizophyllum commune Loenen D]|nr:hypothetical protein K525DRAFT_266811 [Schizophyllum commune Loenen D]